MMRKLRLAEFGRFRQRDFDFGPVTIFHGANESGKSTIFDAIFDQLAPPKATSEKGRDLAGRYGKNRLAGLDWSGLGLKLDADEFLNIFAVRSGELGLDLKTDSDWTGRIKAGLFSGGVDPGRIAAELEKRASPKGTTSEAKMYNEVVRNKAELETRLAQKKADRSVVLSGDRQRVSGENEAARIQAELSADEARLGGLKGQIEQQRLIREQRELRTVIDFERSLREETGRLAALSAYARNDEGEYNQLAAGRAAADQQAAVVRSELRTNDDRVRRLQAGLQETRSRLDLAGKAARAAGRGLALLEESGRPSGHWSAPVLAAAGLSLCAGLAAALLVPDLLMRVLAGFTGLFLGLMLVLLARPAGSARAQAGQNLAAEVRRAWSEETGLAFPFEDAGVEELAGRLREIEAEPRSLAGRLAEREQELGLGTHAVEDCRRRALDIEEKQGEAVGAMAAWLAAHGVADFGAYQRLRLERAEAERRLAGLRSSLDELCRRKGVEDAAALRALAVSRLALIEERIHAPAAGDEEVKRLENQAQAMGKGLETKRRAKAGLDTALAEQRGETRGTLGKLPDEIIDLERRQAGLVQKIESEAITRRAAGMAAGIFRELDIDASIKFDSLCREVSELYGRVVGGPRSVALQDFDTETMTVQDAGGALRPLKKLSKGTRAGFLFTARLVLAEKALAGRDIPLLLDDPFESLDPAREEQALVLLEQLFVSKGRQIVVFTKEPRLREAARRHFPAAVVHELAST